MVLIGLAFTLGPLGSVPVWVRFRSKPAWIRSSWIQYQVSCKRVDRIQIGADRQRGCKIHELEAFQTCFFCYPSSWRLTHNLIRIKLNIIAKAFLNLRWIYDSLGLVLYLEASSYVFDNIKFSLSINFANKLRIWGCFACLSPRRTMMNEKEGKHVNYLLVNMHT